MTNDELYLRSLEAIAEYRAAMSSLGRGDIDLSPQERWVYDELKRAVLRYRRLIESKNL